MNNDLGGVETESKSLQKRTRRPRPIEIDKTEFHLIGDFYPAPKKEVAICDFDVKTRENTVRLTVHVQGWPSIPIRFDVDSPCKINIKEWTRGIQRALQSYVSAYYGSVGCPPFWSRCR